jgi:AcrR family transcriptional regulator
VFAEEGLDAHLERIAKEADVGSGTLYRNFPTRESLIEAAYRNEVAKLCDAAPALLREMPPRQALRAWMGRSGRPEQREQAERLLDFTLDAMSTTRSASS